MFYQVQIIVDTVEAKAWQAFNISLKMLLKLKLFVLI